jgi:hypothetical protein
MDVNIYVRRYDCGSIAEGRGQIAEVNSKAEVFAFAI